MMPWPATRVKRVRHKKHESSCRDVETYDEAPLPAGERFKKAASRWAKTNTHREKEYHYHRNRTFSAKSTASDPLLGIALGRLFCLKKQENIQLLRFFQNKRGFFSRLR